MSDLAAKAAHSRDEAKEELQQKREERKETLEEHREVKRSIQGLGSHKCTRQSTIPGQASQLPN